MADKKGKMRFFVCLFCMLAVLAAAAVFLRVFPKEWGGWFGYTEGLGTASRMDTAPEEGTESVEDVAQMENSAVIAAPDILLRDSAGSSVRLSEYFGKPIVLHFWASWSLPCRQGLPALDKLAAEFSGKVDFLLVNLSDGELGTALKTASFVNGHGYTFPVFHATAEHGSAIYAVKSLPMTYFINAEGFIVAYSPSVMSERLLRAGLEMVLGYGGNGSS